MRKKVRGLRTLEKEILADKDQYQESIRKLTSEQQTYATKIVLDYCAAIRGYRYDNHGGPLKPPGLLLSQLLKKSIAQLNVIFHFDHTN